jgi:hypothetical protein
MKKYTFIVLDRYDIIPRHKNIYWATSLVLPPAPYHHPTTPPPPPPPPPPPHPRIHGACVREAVEINKASCRRGAIRYRGCERMLFLHLPSVHRCVSLIYHSTEAGAFSNEYRTNVHLNLKLFCLQVFY